MLEEAIQMAEEGRKVKGSFDVKKLDLCTDDNSVENSGHNKSRNR